MRLRRVHLGSLLVVALALAGATVVPVRDAARTHAPIVWQAGEVHRARVSALQRPQRTASPRHRQSHPLRSASHAVSTPVRHALFQRPPPVALDRI